MQLEQASNPKKTENNQLFSPFSAWLPIIGFILVTIGLLAVKVSSPLNYFFPLGSVLIAFLLYSRYFLIYLGFSWWIWFVSPFIARLVEYQNSWTDPGLRLIILAPYLVTSITAIKFFEKLPVLISEGGAAFVFSFISIIYALFIGLAKGNSIIAIGQAFLSWSVGIFLGSYFLVNWRYYPQIRQNVQRVFYWAVLIMGLYGIYQYIFAPEWDTFWLKNAEDLQLCCGWPAPFEIRVWSTLNYPFTFSYAMMSCLLVLFANKRNPGFPALLTGLVSFLLSRVRGAWLGFAIGLTTFFISVKSNLQIRLILTFFVVGIFLVAVANSTPQAQEIIQRLQTFTDLGNDHSANERLEIYAQLFHQVTSDYIGRGMGGKSIIDAGALSVLAILGWLGLIPYLIAILLVFYTLFQNKLATQDSFATAARAIVVSVFVSLPFNNVFILLPGVLFWGFSGLGIAAQKYASKQISSN